MWDVSHDGCDEGGEKGEKERWCGWKENWFTAATASGNSWLDCFCSSRERRKRSWNVNEKVQKKEICLLDEKAQSTPSDGIEIWLKFRCYFLAAVDIFVCLYLFVFLWIYIETDRPLSALCWSACLLSNRIRRIFIICAWMQFTGSYWNGLQRSRVRMDNSQSRSSISSDWIRIAHLLFPFRFNLRPDAS